MPHILKIDAPMRTVIEVGPGDFIKVPEGWREIRSNTAHQSSTVPRHWTVVTTDGVSYDYMEIARYAKADDLESSNFFG